MFRTFRKNNSLALVAVFSMFLLGCELDIGIKQTNETVDSGGGDIGVPNSCGELASGETETRTRFESASVVAPASCQAELQVRVCNDGVLSDFNGSFTNASCQVAQAPVVVPPVTPPQSCGSVASGDSQTRIRYQAASVIAPASCTSETQTRLCTNGVFSAYSGSFANANCSVTQPPVEDLSRVSDQTYKNFNLPIQTGSFEIGFNLTPRGNNIDSATALAANSVSTYNDMAAIVRFNPAGQIDVRNGSVYAADSVINYVANKVYSIRMAVNVAAHSYSVFVRIDGGAEQTLASNYGFRTQQASINSISKIVIRAEAGSHALGELSAIIGGPDVPPASCGALASGESETRIRYLQASVVSPATCVGETQTRSCSNGNLSAYSGTFTNAACNVDPANPDAGGMNGPIKVSQNSRWFTDDSGKPIVFGGAHTWMSAPATAFSINIDEYLGRLKSFDHNFLRLWAQEGYVDIYSRTGPGSTNGGLKYDLTKFNQSYFNQLRTYVQKAKDKGIYVSVMLFEGWGLKNGSAEDWATHPFHKDNNINGINGDPNGDNAGLEAHTLDISAITAIQKKYVEKVVDTLNDFDNIIFEIANEDFGGSKAFSWQVAMMNHLRSFEASKPKKHLVGMSCIYNGSAPSNMNSSLKSSSADWVSLCGGTGSGNDMTTNPAAASGSKVMFIDSDHIWGVGGDSTWVWKVFTRGYNPLYLDSYGDAEEPTPRNQNETLDAIGQTIAYGQKMNLLNIQPSSGTCNTGYCLAGGGEYLVFNPSNSTTTVKNLPAGTYSYEWLNVGSGSISAPATFTQSSTGDVSPSGRPSAAHVLYMKKL